MTPQRSSLFALLGSLAAPPWEASEPTSGRRTRGRDPQDPQVIARRAARQSLGQASLDARAFLARTDVVPEDGQAVLAARVLRWLPRSANGLRPRFTAQLEDDAGVETFGATRTALWTLGNLGLDELEDAARLILHRAAAEPCSGPVGIVPEGVLTCVVDGESWADPAVIAEALVPVLLALRAGRLHFEDLVDVCGCLHNGEERVRPSVVADLLRRNLHYLTAHLLSPDFENGTPSCPSPDLLLARVSELWRLTTPLSATLRRPLQTALLDRLDMVEPASAMDQAARLVAAENLHLPRIDLAAERLGLAAMQEADGGFPAAPTWRPAPGKSAIGSRAFTTALVLRALEGQPRCRLARC
ncbi:MAG: hypothetical protein AAGE94_09945 [Acidobacteriota bacterium]